MMTALRDEAGFTRPFGLEIPAPRSPVGMIPPDSGRCYAVTFPMRDEHAP